MLAHAETREQVVMTARIRLRESLIK
jgi:hypothetical protein